MATKTFTASPVWFASLVSLLVAFGSQVLIENILPVSLFDFFPSTSRAIRAGEWWWIYYLIIRFISFAMGGVIAVLLARGKTRFLISSLTVVAVVATLSQFPELIGLPSRASIVLFAFWWLAAPAGSILGAWLAGANRVSSPVTPAK